MFRVQSNLLKCIVPGVALLLACGCGEITNENIETRVVTEEEMRELPALPPMNSKFIPQNTPPASPPGESN